MMKGVRLCIPTQSTVKIRLTKYFMWNGHYSIERQIQVHTLCIVGSFSKIY